MRPWVAVARDAKERGGSPPRLRASLVVLCRDFRSMKQRFFAVTSRSRGVLKKDDWDLGTFEFSRHA